MDINSFFFLKSIATFSVRFDKSLLGIVSNLVVYQVKVTGYNNLGRARNGKNLKVFREE